MAGICLQSVVRHLRRFAETDAAGAPSDAQLLERFVRAGDHGAFELLLWRHGTMVHGLCRRVLRHEQDAEDAFQAAFLALARKARSVAKQSSVGGWLYTVAYRAALAARERAVRRTARELPFTDAPARPDGRAEGCDLRAVLDAEITRLPDRYRVPFVLCHLEGLTVAEAAQRLGRPRGTVGARLSRARARLRARLLRRGIVPAAAAALVAGGAADAGPPAGLVAATLRVAAESLTNPGAAAAPVAALTESVMRGLLFSHVKSAVAAVAIVLALGAGGWTVQALAAGRAAEDKAAAAAERLVIPGWGRAIDPDGDCKFTVGQGTLTIGVPGTDHDLGVERGLMNTPRVLREVEGDFIAQVRVVGPFPKGAKSVTDKRQPFFGAGLLLYKDDKTYVRLEKAELNLDGTQYSYANWELRRDGEWVRHGSADDGTVPDTDAWLRLERRGGRLYGYHSPDGVAWTALEPIEVELPRKVQIGVSGGHDTSTPFNPSFDSFRLYQVTAASPPTGRPEPKAAKGFTAQMMYDLTFQNVVPSADKAIMAQWLNQANKPAASAVTVKEVYTQNLAELLMQDMAKYALFEGQSFKVGEVRIVGNSQISEDLIRERLGLTPGQVITAADLKQAEAKLRDSRIFKHAPTVTAADAKPGEFKTVVITVRDK